MESRVSRALSHLAVGLDLGHQVVGIPVGLAKAVMVKRGSIRSIADIMINDRDLEHEDEANSIYEKNVRRRRINCGKQVYIGCWRAGSLDMMDDLLGCIV